MDRRSLLLGLGATLICAPAIVRASSLMPVKTWRPPVALPFDQMRYMRMVCTSDDPLKFVMEASADQVTWHRWFTTPVATRIKILASAPPTTQIYGAFAARELAA